MATWRARDACRALLIDRVRRLLFAVKPVALPLALALPSFFSFMSSATRSPLRRGSGFTKPLPLSVFFLKFY
jgi:hypothetical protein